MQNKLVRILFYFILILVYTEGIIIRNGIPITFFKAILEGSIILVFVLSIKIIKLSNKAGAYFLLYIIYTFLIAFYHNFDFINWLMHIRFFIYFFILYSILWKSKLTIFNSGNQSKKTTIKILLCKS